MKAFLSHSSVDKEFVRAVAVELGRQFCVFDEQAFSTGDEFKASIERGFDDSTAFVFFASRSSLNSIWVDFEIDEAWYRKLRGSISKSIVYLIDSSIGVGDVPEWLRRALARRENSPKVVARDIRSHLDELLVERQRLVQFRTAVFLGHLGKLGLEEYEQHLLQILATYSPLPLPVLAQVLAVDLKKLDESVIKLIDLALVVTTEEGFYRIADPIAEAAIKAFGYPADVLSKAVANHLAGFLQTCEVDRSRLALSRVVFRAALLAKEHRMADGAPHLANDLIRLTETFYHERQYLKSIEYGNAALSERPESISARSYLIRALIQEEMWKDAEEQLLALQEYAPVREVHFLSGFLERRRGKVSLALVHYEKARQAGRRGSAISRELALCHFLLGDHERARKYIDEALTHHGDNRYVVDLWVQIALRGGDEPTARKALDRLEIIDDPLYFKHRLSTVEFAFGNLQAALAAARQSVEGAQFPHFEALAHLIHCEIEAGNHGVAEEFLSKLDHQFSNSRRDLRIALRCWLEIARGKYREALLQSERIDQKNTSFYRRIRHDALVGELRAYALGDQTRRAYERELEALEKAFADELKSKFAYFEFE